jgi:hypothetical protein
MTTQLNAMKQALEALELVYATCDWHTDDGNEAMQKASAAITSLRTAIEQAEKQEPAPVQEPTKLKPEDVIVETYSDQQGGFMLRLQNGVRLTHKPTGIVVECNTERSQHRNREHAWHELERRLYTTPPAAPVQEPVAWVDWVNAVMSQAQVFASTWSLVGGRFDDGSAYDQAEEAKQELRTMLANPPAAQPAPDHIPDATKMVAAPVQDGVGGCAMCGAAYEDQVIKAPLEPAAWADMGTRAVDNDAGLSWTPGHFHTTPLYTTQPATQRQWAVPDTMKVSTAPSYEFANGWNACVAAIKAKLKEKNT